MQVLRNLLREHLQPHAHALCVTQHVVRIVYMLPGDIVDDIYSADDLLYPPVHLIFITTTTAMLNRVGQCRSFWAYRPMLWNLPLIVDIDVGWLQLLIRDDSRLGFVTVRTVSDVLMSVDSRDSQLQLVESISGDSRQSFFNHFYWP